MTMQRRTFITAIGATAATMSIAGCTGDDEPSDSSSGGADSTSSGDSSSGSADGSKGTDSGSSKPKLEILEDEFYEEDMSAGVKGTVINNSDSEISYVGVQAKFLDSEGTRVGEGMDNTTELGGGQKWSFDAMYMDTESDQIDDYKIEVSDSPF